MAVWECKVSFIDARGIRHTTTVHATTVLEAAAVGLKQIRDGRWLAMRVCWN